MIYRLTEEHARRIRVHDARWVTLMARFGFNVIRSANGWVTYDGCGTIAVVPNYELDADDTLAQILLHELLHHFVEGPESYDLPDWGLDNTSERHTRHEYATLHVQAALLDPFGLRHILVPTTDFREYYEALRDPIEGSGDQAIQRRVENALRRLTEHHAFNALTRELEFCRQMCRPSQLFQPTKHMASNHEFER